MLKGYVIGTLLVSLALILLVFSLYTRLSATESASGEKLKIEKFYDRVVDVARVIRDACKDPDFNNIQELAQNLSDNDITVTIQQSPNGISYSVEGFGLHFENTTQC